MRGGVMVALAVWCISPVTAGDLYTAKASYEKKDYAAAFAEFRALAELGHPLAQEILALMYAKGEGVTRDGVRAYAWANVALENGAGNSAKVIVEQLQPFVTPQTRQPVDEVHAAFGKQALEERLLPAVREPGSTSPGPTCKMAKPVNPDLYYPARAKKAEISGSVMVSTIVLPDGRARNPRVLYSVPWDTFEAAGRQITFDTEFDATQADGVAVTCTLAFSVHFSMPDVLKKRALLEQLERLKTSALGGDPSAQLQYAMLMSSWRQLNPERRNFASMFQQAAQAGLPPAQYIVGVGALRGVGFKKNRQKGVAWLEMAARAGQPDAQVALANELMREAPKREEISRARELLASAVTSGSQEARYYLADLLVGDPDPAMREPRHAIELLDGLSRDEDPSTHELRAAASSQIGDFIAATKTQKRALERARKLKWDVRPQAERLASYENQKAWAGLLLTY